MKILSTCFIDDEGGRCIKVELDTGAHITIEECWESWEQYGGTTEELYFTMPIAEKYNGWLHGEDFIN